MRALGIVVLLATAAHAETAVHVGPQLSSDADTQQMRLGGGVRFGAVKLAAAADVQLYSDGSDDVDLTVEVAPRAAAWALLAGWRTSAIAIERGRQWQQHVLAGATGNLPTLGRIRPSFGIVFAATIVRHGDALATDWISLASQRHVRDTVSTNLFVRFDYESVF